MTNTKMIKKRVFFIHRLYHEEVPDAYVFKSQTS